MAIASKYPSIRPSLDLNFAGSKTVDPRITFTRASTATYFDEKGVLRSAASGVPRIDHNPLTGECLGLLIEEQRTNLLTYSEQFDNAAWSKLQTTITPNAAIAPDGTLTAGKLVENSSTTGHYIGRQVSVTEATTYTESWFVKKEERSNFAISCTSSTTVAYAGFNLATGTITTTGGTGYVSSGIQSHANGWYRVWIVFTAQTTENLSIQRRVINTSGASFEVYTGDGTSGIYIWGAQLEAGTNPSSYIKTEASQVTRAADNAVMTGANFSSWYRQDEGTFVTKVLADNYAVTGAQVRTFAQVEDASNPSTNSMRFGRGAAAAIRFQNNQDILLPSAAIAFGTITPGNDDTFAVAYSSAVPSLVLDGVLYNPITSGYSSMTAGKNRLALGGDGAGTATAQLNGHIKRLAYYPRRLTNDHLVALTQ